MKVWWLVIAAVTTVAIPLRYPVTRTQTTVTNCIEIKNRLISFWNNFNGQTNRDDILYYYSRTTGPKANIHILIR